MAHWGTGKPVRRPATNSQLWLDQRFTASLCLQSKEGKGSGNMEQTAKTWLTGGQKWLKKAGTKLATAAKEGAAEVQKRMEAADIKLTKGVIAIRAHHGIAKL